MDKEQVLKNVGILLEKYPGLKSPEKRAEAHWSYWQMFDGVGEFGVLKKQYIFKLTPVDLISEVLNEVAKNPEILNVEKLIKEE